MNFANPKQVNDDYVRTGQFRLSLPSMSNDGTFQPTRFISCTIKHVQGDMSSFLHKMTHTAAFVWLSGIGGGLLLREKRSASSTKTSLHRCGSGHQTVFSARGDEVNLAKEFEDSNSMRQITVFDSRAGLEIAIG
ncbi:hypothetical protein BDR26DRAFT_991268 [Obelidium mucronatum]|nr:hypothetical protein BDR26DRAFT_991268 [Obelidium mucronatum]